MEKEKKILTWDECKDELEVVVALKNDVYNESFNNARKATIRPLTEAFIAQNPEATKEELKQYVEDYLAQTPDEFQRNLRTYCSTMGAVWNMLNAIRVEISDFKDTFIALNSDKAQAFAKKQASLIRKQQIEEAKKKEEDSNFADIEDDTKKE